MRAERARVWLLAVLIVGGCQAVAPSGSAGPSSSSLAPAPSASQPTASNGAGAALSPLPLRSLGPDEFWLPSDPALAMAPGASQQACAGIGLAMPGASQEGMPLNGSRTDPRYVWLGPSMMRRDLVWSPGYSVRFTASGFEVLDQTGAVRHKSGDWIDGGCVTGSPDVLWIPDW